MAGSRNISLDIGGSFIKCSDGRKIPVDSGGTSVQIADAIREAIGPVADLASIGVCIPGPFDYREGIFLMKHKFAAVYGDSFRRLAGVPDEVGIRFVHDVVAPLKGLVMMHPEFRWCTAGLITIGTGLGFSHAVNGKVIVNEMLSPAFSLYNLPYKDGILEDYVSRRGILRRYGKSVEGDVSQIAALARVGDPEALEAFHSAAEALAECAGPYLMDLGITVLMFGGQISKAFDLMKGTLEEALPGIRLNQVEDYDNAVMRGLVTK